MLRSRRSRLLTPAALVAAIAAAGCLPVVSNQQAAQQDVIGDVNVSADVCVAPQLLATIIGGGGSLPFRGARDAITRGGGPVPGDVLDCPPADALYDMLDGDETENIFAGIPHQLLVNVRVPEGTTAPETFTAAGESLVQGVWQTPSDEDAAPERRAVEVTFTRSADLEEQSGGLYDLAYSGLDGAPDVIGDGQKIVGYISSPLPGPLVGDLQVDVPFGLPGADGDAPYTGPFNALTMAGTRIAIAPEQFPSLPRAARALRGGPPSDLDAISPDRPIDCLDDELSGGLPRGPLEDILSLAWCPFPGTFFVSGTPEEVIEELEKTVRGVDAKTRDLRIAGGEGFAEQGQTATVPFTLRTAGDASAEELALTASTAAGGAIATPRQAATTFPATGSHGRQVDVQIPENATPGTYEVTLTARNGDAARTGTGRVVVLPKAASAASLPGTGAPRGRGRDNVYMDRQGNIAFGWICPPACGDARVDVTSPKAGIAPNANTAAVSKPRLLRIARGKFAATAGKRARVKVRLFPRARRAVRRGRNVKAVIVVRSANGTPAVRRVTIKRSRPRR